MNIEICQVCKNTNKDLLIDQNSILEEYASTDVFLMIILTIAINIQSVSLHHTLSNKGLATSADIKKSSRLDPGQITSQALPVTH